MRIKSNFTIVDKYLLRGARPTIKQVFQLKKEGVTQIYDFRHKSRKGMKFLEKIACRIAGIKYHREAYSFYGKNFPGIEHFEQITKSIKQNGENGGKTYIHCNSGRHRTSLMAAFYHVTKGEELKKVITKDPVEYRNNLAEAINDQIIGADFFNKCKKADTQDRAAVATIEAFIEFIQMFK